MTGLLFDGFAPLIRVLIQGTFGYFALVLILRVSGKRTLAKMNAFDLVVTVALGSALATILLSKDVALASGITALALLAALQYAVTWTSVRLPWVRRVIRSEPRLLAIGGVILPSAVRAERVTEEEIEAAVRSAGRESLDQVHAVVLETDGSFSVLERMDLPTPAAPPPD